MPTQPHDLLLVGVIGPAHGIRGEVKLIPESDDPHRLLGLERVWVGVSAGEAAERAVVGARMQYGRRGPVVLLRLEGVLHRDAAAELRRLRVYALAADLPAPEGGLYLHDLLGLAVHVEGEPGPIGTVEEVIEGVAQDLLVVRRPGRPDALVPDVPEIVVDVDPEAGTVTLRPPEGLLD